MKNKRNTFTGTSPMYSINELSQTITLVTRADLDTASSTFNNNDTVTFTFTKFHQWLLELADVCDDILNMTDDIASRVKTNSKDNVYMEIADFNPYINSENLILSFIAKNIKDEIKIARDKMDHLAKIDSSEKEMLKTLEKWSECLRNSMKMIYADTIITDADNRVSEYTRQLITITDENGISTYYLDDEMLLNLIFDYFCVLNKQGFAYCTCKYCGNGFVGIRSNDVCSDTACQKAHKKDKHNTVRRKKRNESYDVYINRFNETSKQSKTRFEQKLWESYPEDVVEKTVGLYEVKIEELREKVADRVEEYRRDNRDPGDREFTEFYKGVLSEMNVYRNELEIELK